MTHELLVKHFRAVADASPLPVLIYNMPAFTGIDLALNTLVELAAHPNIVGIKDSGSNVIKMGSLLAACPDFTVLAGTGGALLPFLSIGASGGVMALANFAAEPLNRLYQAFLKEDWNEARRLQYALMDINSAVTTRFGVPGLKYAMDQSGFYGGPCRKPLLPIPAETAAVIDGLLNKLKDAGLL
jgi:4-hydroxy-2-oxoglutarate aldolase